jgi:hypothetical protein
MSALYPKRETDIGKPISNIEELPSLKKSDRQMRI